MKAVFVLIVCMVSIMEVYCQEDGQFPDSLAVSMNSSAVVNEMLQLPHDTLEIQSSDGSTFPANSANIQSDTAFRSDFDQIVTIDNKVIIARITRIGPGEVNFVYPFNTEANSISRDIINCIIHETGRKEIFNLVDQEDLKRGDFQENFVVEKKKKVWEEVDTTYHEEKTSGMVEIDRFVVQYESSKMRATVEFLEKNALIILRKKAAHAGAELVLITYKKVHTAYGDLPSIEMEGIAYSNAVAENEQNP